MTTALTGDINRAAVEAARRGLDRGLCVPYDDARNEHYAKVAAAAVVAAITPLIEAQRDAQWKKWIASSSSPDAPEWARWDLAVLAERSTGTPPLRQPTDAELAQRTAVARREYLEEVERPDLDPERSTGTPNKEI